MRVHQKISYAGLLFLLYVRQIPCPQNVNLDLEVNELIGILTHHILKPWISQSYLQHFKGFYYLSLALLLSSDY